MAWAAAIRSSFSWCGTNPKNSTPGAGFAWSYAVSATEEVACKNGKTQVWWTHGLFTDPGTQWPDSFEMDVEDAARAAWDLNRAEKCKGTGKVTVVMSEEPVVDDAAYEAFVEAQRAGYAALMPGLKDAVVRRLNLEGGPR